MKKNQNMLKLSIATLGVVFGDIGTSPLYAIKECFHGDYGIAVSSENIFGVLSLIFWSLLILVALKYVIIVLRADNHGEGGVFALTSLIRSIDRESKNLVWLILVGIFAGSMLYGDGMITPAISVLSAVDGISMIAPSLSNFVIPITIAILLVLFFIQSKGTAKVGSFFGPVIFLWFSVLAIIGLVHVIDNPEILLAMNPYYGLKFFIINRLHGIVVLGAVFLVATGAEALYADMGHFGTKPIRLTWFILVLPALVLNYFGQGALLLKSPELAENIFYSMVPGWALIPMVLLATFATIIASQAVITGSFSLTKQAINQGFLPKLKIVQTSSEHSGQIYVPVINWFLMLSTIGLVLGFRSATNLAAAYGVAVNFTMIITSLLIFIVLRKKFNWGVVTTLLFVGFFLVIESAFFMANISKFFHGAWFPLLIGAVFYIIMVTWEKGRAVLYDELEKMSVSFDDFMKELEDKSPQRVTGEAVFLTGKDEIVPTSLIQNLKHNKVLQSEVAFIHIKFENTPRVPNLEKITVEKLGKGFQKVVARYGYMEEVNMNTILTLAYDQGLDMNKETLSYFLGREKLVLSEKPKMSRWRANLFIFMSKLSLDFSSFADIPQNQIIEIGVELKI